MARLVFFAVLLVCMFYVFQASPLPQEAPTSGSTDLDKFGEKAKEAWDNAKSTLEKQFDELMQNPSVKSALENTKEFVQKASETIRKEAEKIGDKLHD